MNSYLVFICLYRSLVAVQMCSLLLTTISTVDIGLIKIKQLISSLKIEIKILFIKKIPKNNSPILQYNASLSIWK